MKATENSELKSSAVFEQQCLSEYIRNLSLQQRMNQTEPIGNEIRFETEINKMRARSEI